MKNIIIYASMTGHSKKIAQAISEKLGIEAFNIKDNPKIEGYDMGIFVSGIYSGECKMELIEFAKKLTPANIKSVIRKPRISFAFSNSSLANGDDSYKSFPIPTNWAPWPGNT